MTEKTNIRLFDEMTALIFARLYDSFPVPVSIECHELTKGREINDFGEYTREMDVCVATLRWLEKEGFISYQSDGHFTAYHITLTSKGLGTLKSVPESLEGQKNIGERLQNAVKAGAINTAIEVVKLVFAVA